MCCAPTEEQGRETAHRYFRWSLAGWPVLAELPTEEAFAAASEQVSVEAVGKAVKAGPPADRHLEAIEKFTAAGCDHIILIRSGPTRISLRAGREDVPACAAGKKRHEADLVTRPRDWPIGTLFRVSGRSRDRAGRRSARTFRGQSAPQVEDGELLAILLGPRGSISLYLVYPVSDDHRRESRTADSSQEARQPYRRARLGRHPAPAGHGR